ncbi:MAG: Glu/Leu/Phe/Val dehydrogenase dimerization domain-containing protein [Candidatus Paceibacterota bacterium]
MEHNNKRGPYKGGNCFHQDADMNEVNALALWMSLKCAVANIPMGGGKGGVTVDPKTLSTSELEKTFSWMGETHGSTFGSRKRRSSSRRKHKMAR